MIDIRHIKHLGQISDMIKLHKKGHVINLHKMESMDSCAWSIYIDNQKTEKRKVLYVRFERDGLIIGRVNILKGFSTLNCTWGKKLHKEPQYLEIDDLGYLKFQHFIDTRCICKTVERVGNWTASDYIYEPSK